MHYYSIIDSPVDPILLTSDGEVITSAWMHDEHHVLPLQDMQKSPALFKQAEEQLSAYFAGELTNFSLPLNPAGTVFQKQVWTALQTIPFGQTVSYKDIAIAVGNPNAVRAVGAANGKNPIGIIIPCHRVIGSNGQLTGYAGGLHRKQWLLQHEQSLAGNANNQPRLI